MAVNVPSGIITIASGAGVPRLTVNALPVALFGASGDVAISHYSGAINVNISGGNLTVDISGDVVSISGQPVNVVSGQVRALISGDWVTLVVSGNQVIIPIGGDGVASNILAVGHYAFGGGGWDRIRTMEASISTGLGVLAVGVIGQGSDGIFRPIRIAPANADALDTDVNRATYTLGTHWIFNGSTWDRARGVAGSSGGSLGVIAVQQVGYSYTLVSGASLVNIKSGAAFLHAINVNGYGFSGTQVEIRDSASGVAGLVLGTIAAINSGTSVAPTNLLYDTLMTSGIVISTSGIAWNLTVAWRTATS